MNKSADEISPKILKLSGNIIAYPLMFIFNKAMEDATYPNRMKIAKVLALFKKNPKYIPENYRRINLSPSLDKIFEKMIYKRFSLFIEKHTILYLAFIDMTDTIREILDKKQYALGIHLDLKRPLIPWITKFY